MSLISGIIYLYFLVNKLYNHYGSFYVYHYLPILTFCLNFKSRDFKLRLRPTSRTTFANQQVEINSVNNARDINEFLNFYEGYLLDEPNDSFVSRSIIDGVFYGTITSKSH